MRALFDALTIAILSSAVVGSSIAAQAVPSRELGETEQLVVMVRCFLPNGEQIGAGIIFGAANDRLYILTANHVVRLGSVGATDIRVELRSRPGELVPATLTTRFDAGADLAVLSIAGIKALGVDTTRIPFDRLGDPAALVRGDGVYALGYPEGKPWTVNVAPIPVSGVSDSLLTFETSFVAAGHSGGALLNQHSEIVGLLLNVAPPEATARNISRVLDILRRWKYPVNLRARFDAAALDRVSAGAGFTCSLARDGTAQCWGSNDDGELGTGGRASSMSPARVSTTLRFATISASNGYACALTVAGTAYCWGNVGANSAAVLGTEGAGPVPGTPSARRIPVQVAADLTFTSLSAGFSHACGVTRTGALYCWGDNAEGQLGDGSKTRSTKPVRVATGLTYRSVSAGLEHSCAIAADGRAYCWGGGTSGALGDGSGKSSTRPVAVVGTVRFAAVSAGNSHTCAVTPAGAAYCWGSNDDGQLGNGTSSGATMPTPVVGGHSFRSLSTSRTSGRSITCGVTTSGAPMCWGWESEALGQQNNADEGTPGLVVADRVFQSITVGFSHACGVVKGGDVYCWGDNRYGQLGDGSTTTHITPGLVPIPP
jgi:alpha-tubulin suppressor-like RCC1 family protein